MSVYAITNASSKQYDYIWNSGHCSINDHGYIKVDNEYFGVALGSYFGEIGSKYILTLSTGKKLKICKVEAKADKDTDVDGYLGTGNHIIEFVIDPWTEYMQSLPTTNKYICNGNFNRVFPGYIVAIDKVV